MILPRISSLQKTQFLQEVFDDTHNISLLVCVPEKYASFRASLDIQLHRNFRLNSRPEFYDGESFSGMVLAGADCELLSTALMHFARRLEQGADLVYGDEVYTTEQETYCCRPAGGAVGLCAPAAIAPSLFARIKELAEDPDDMAALLRLAFQEAQRPCRIPIFLACHPDPPKAECLFAPGKKRALLLTHELSMTGAPIVLSEAVPVLRNAGYDVVVLSPEHNTAADLFLNAGATVLVNYYFLTGPGLHPLALECDFILANTVVSSEAVRMLSGSSIPVLWWIHESFSSAPFIENHSPDSLEENITACTVGALSKESILAIRPKYELQQLLYGLEDYAAEEIPRRDFSTGNRLIFLTVGQIIRRKGQDVLAHAIRLLEPEDRDRAIFFFVGSSIDEDIFREVEALKRDFPDCITYIPHLSRDEIKALMAQSFCILCSSREDSMPTFVTEGAIFSTPAIVSQYTGTARLITPGVDGLVYPDNDPEKLAELIRDAIRDPQRIRAMGPGARALYERHFTKEVFARTLNSFLPRDPS